MYSEIQPLRKAARQLVRELNLLDGQYCIEGFNYSECHLLTELDALGKATASELGQRLVLEKSTMSRLVNGLLAKGLIQSGPHSSDRRIHLLKLTDLGRAGVERINHTANAQVQHALNYIAPTQREQIVTGLAGYARALKYSRIGQSFEIRPIRPADNAAVAGVIRLVMSEYGVSGQGFSSEDAEIDDMAEAYSDSRATFLVVVRDGEICGCGGMGPLAGADENICEIRKMYVHPSARGFGIGTPLLTTILNAARKAHYDISYLETLSSMSHARMLYTAFGFKPIDQAMGHTGHSGCNQYMALKL